MNAKILIAVLLAMKMLNLKRTINHIMKMKTWIPKNSNLTMRKIESHKQKFSSKEFHKTILKILKEKTLIQRSVYAIVKGHNVLNFTVTVSEKGKFVGLTVRAQTVTMQQNSKHKECTLNKF